MHKGAFFANKWVLKKRRLDNIKPSELQNMTILDIASHDGRWSFAAIKNGVKEISSIVSSRKYLIENTIKIMDHHANLMTDFPSSPAKCTSI
jgi:hypothetical protein